MFPPLSVLHGDVIAGIGLGRLLGGEHASTLPRWGGGSSPVKTEPPHIVLLLLLCCCVFVLLCCYCVVVAVSDAYESVCMCTTPQTCMQLQANLKGVQTWRRGPAQSRELPNPSPDLSRIRPLTSLITTPPLVIRDGNTGKAHMTATSSKLVDESES